MPGFSIDGDSTPNEQRAESPLPSTPGSFNLPTPATPEHEFNEKKSKKRRNFSIDDLLANAEAIKKIQSIRLEPKAATEQHGQSTSFVAPLSSLENPSCSCFSNGTNKAASNVEQLTGRSAPPNQAVLQQFNQSQKLACPFREPLFFAPCIYFPQMPPPLIDQQILSRFNQECRLHQVSNSSSISTQMKSDSSVPNSSKTNNKRTAPASTSQNRTNFQTIPQRVPTNERRPGLINALYMKYLIELERSRLLPQQIASKMPPSHPPNNVDVQVSSPDPPPDPEQSKDYCCEWDKCKLTFHDSAAYFEHVKQHTEDQTIKTCKWRNCARIEAFGAHYQLNLHMLHHTGEKPNKCPHCEKCYSRPENLKTHLRRHNGDKPYKCTKCPKSFTNASDCSKHMKRTHSKEKRYKCPMQNCGKCYQDPSSRRKHMKNHHGHESHELFMKSKTQRLRRGRKAPVVQASEGQTQEINEADVPSTSKPYEQSHPGTSSQLDTLQTDASSDSDSSDEEEETGPSRRE